MTNNNEPPIGHIPTDKSGLRRFRVVRVPEKPDKKSCPHCQTDWVGCPECERKKLIPNAVGLQFTSSQIFHHGQCHRHGYFWRRCPHYPDTVSVGESPGARIERGRMVAIVVAFTTAAFALGMVAGIAFVYIQRAILAH